MLSDDSSSDSETGRFKGRSERQDERIKSSNQRDDNCRLSGRSRPTNVRIRREFERKRDDRSPRERHRYSRNSPIGRKRHSRERSPFRRRSVDRHRHGNESLRRSKMRDHRSSSRDKARYCGTKIQKSIEHRRDLKEEIKRNIIPLERKSIEKSNQKSRDNNERKSKEKDDRRSREQRTLSPNYKGKRSEVHKPKPSEQKRKSESPIIIEEHGDTDKSEEVQLGSYYNIIPAIVKEKADESSEIDSSDDERLRAKLLNLEKELHKTRKKKHKKKHKMKSSKSSKDRDTLASVEVTSTTDIDKVNSKSSDDLCRSTLNSAEVTSTQKSVQKDSGEEGEILSDDDSQAPDYDPDDLRHKLKRSAPKIDVNPSDLCEKMKLKTDVCGPALPPHLQQHSKHSGSPNVEGPALPPHLTRKDSNIGPSIPDDMRKVLADREVIKYESSDEDIGIGPLPVGTEEKWSDAHKRLETRALEMKIRKLHGHTLQKSDIKSREQWMLELPEAKAKYMGLEARTFRAKEGPDMSDRSSWTDTPEEKALKAAGVVKQEDADTALQREARARHIANRDDEQEKAAKKHKKKHKRDDSLLDIHQKKLKKKKKKEEKDEGKKERRPFSRDVDLQVNRFDEAQKKSIIKKAQVLDTRFSQGEAKYL